MRRRLHRTTRLGDIALFWSLTVLCALILSVLAFAAGKYWVGGLMTRSASTQTAPQVVVKTPQENQADNTPDANQGPERVEPPSQAVVKMQPRAPTDAERNEIEQQYPQDAAGLHKAGGQDQGDASTGADDKPLGDQSAGGASGRYAVTAGSFADAANAQRVVEELKNEGYDPHIVKITRNGRTLQRVIAGRYDDRAKAEEVCDQLNSEGREATVSTR